MASSTEGPQTVTVCSQRKKRIANIVDALLFLC